MTADLDLQGVKEWRGLRGFTNLFHKEQQAWWATRRGWINALVWTGLLGGLVSIMLFMLPALATATGDPNVAVAGGPAAFGLQMGRSVFFELGTIALAIGVIVLGQDLVVDERQTGVTEWLLSKPVARPAYVLAKFSATLLAVLAIMVALPALVVFGLLAVGNGGWPPLLPFLGGLGLMTVHTVFYLSLTLLLGTCFTTRPPILGIALGLLLGGSLLASLVPALAAVTPWLLAKAASLVANGLPVPGSLLWPPVLATLGWSGAFLLAALVKFEKTEF